MTTSEGLVIFKKSLVSHWSVNNTNTAGSNWGYGGLKLEYTVCVIIGLLTFLEISRKLCAWYVLGQETVCVGTWSRWMILFLQPQNILVSISHTSKGVPSSLSSTQFKPAVQSYINRYNLTDGTSGSCNFYERSLLLTHMKDSFFNSQNLSCWR